MFWRKSQRELRSLKHEVASLKERVKVLECRHRKKRYYSLHPVFGVGALHVEECCDCGKRLNTYPTEREMMAAEAATLAAKADEINKRLGEG
jgi:hypothetical protein